MLLHVDDLSVAFATDTGLLHALNNVSFELAAGESLGLVGESGCGKSTLGFALMRLLAENGGIVGGNPTGGTNPLQTRNPHRNGAHPSYLYGELVSQYLSNFLTQYQTDNQITYFPGGDTTKPAATTRRLQVPYLIAHKGTGGDAPHGGVTRQWIIDYLPDPEAVNPDAKMKSYPDLSLEDRERIASYLMTLN